eukprot:TRINITY_DN275_c0_g3_i3.p1 TRINITY_DN275_c0_g3~~TRINITY_DN275_c0_g3_i3.p1  ORF type:complete len:277 (+),score=87.39 TRINITY_DN275_c0_g3_i3:316-1146(+)
MLKLRRWRLPRLESDTVAEGDSIDWGSSGSSKLYPPPLWQDREKEVLCRPGLSLSCEKIAPDKVRIAREAFWKKKRQRKIASEKDFVQKEYDRKDHDGMPLDAYLLSEGLNLFHVLKLPKGTLIPENLSLENDHDTHYSLSVNDDSGVPIKPDGEFCFVEAIESLGWVEDPMIVMSGRGSPPDWFAPPGGAMEALVSIALASSDIDILFAAMKFCCEVPDEMVIDPKEQEELFEKTITFIELIISDVDIDVEMAEAAEDETKMILGIVRKVVVFGG